MSDRAYTAIDIERSLLTEKAIKILESWGFRTDDDGEAKFRLHKRDLVTYYDQGADYGGNGCTGDLRVAGICFTGWHGAGVTYDAMVFAFDGETYIEQQGTAGPTVNVPESGIIDRDRIAEAMLYWAVYRRALDPVQETAEVGR